MINEPLDNPHAGCRNCHGRTLEFPFTMAFQPVVDIETRRIICHEALVRGPAGEGAATILAKVDDHNRYAFDQFCRVKAIQLAAELGLTSRLNINFLPNAVYDAEACIHVTLKAAQKYQFPLDRITFEIVEHEDVVQLTHLQHIFLAYRRHGFEIALDDFGTGYSGLQRLAELKPDIAKLDRALVAGCDSDPTRLAICRSVINLCDELGVELVIEGVETAGEIAALRAIGARFMQGFYFARPAFQALVTEADIPWL